MIWGSKSARKLCTPLFTKPRWFYQKWWTQRTFLRTKSDDLHAKSTFLVRAKVRSTFARINDIFHAQTLKIHRVLVKSCISTKWCKKGDKSDIMWWYIWRVQHAKGVLSTSNLVKPPGLSEMGCSANGSLLITKPGHRGPVAWSRSGRSDGSRFARSGDPGSPDLVTSETPLF